MCVLTTTGIIVRKILCHTCLRKIITSSLIADILTYDVIHCFDEGVPQPFPLLMSGICYDCEGESPNLDIWKSLQLYTAGYWLTKGHPLSISNDFITNIFVLS